jgi:hypothetical protein
MYESEITLFLKQLKQARPELEKHQLEGRALLWDRALEEDLMCAQQKSRIAQKPYVYQTS